VGGIVHNNRKISGFSIILGHSSSERKKRELSTNVFFSTWQFVK
jgi:hypothetical protein